MHGQQPRHVARYGSRAKSAKGDGLSIPRAETSSDAAMAKSGNEARQRLYMRMISRFSQQFGNDEHSLKVIGDCLNSKLYSRDRIEAKDFDEIHEEVRRRLKSANRKEFPRTHQSVSAGGPNL